MSSLNSEYFNILIFHGASSKETINAANKFSNNLSGFMQNFSISFLKFCSPSFEKSLEDAYNKGFRKIKCLPLFVLPGSHILKDIPEIVHIFLNKHKDCKIEVLPCLIENANFLYFIRDTFKNG